MPSPVNRREFLGVMGKGIAATALVTPLLVDPRISNLLDNARSRPSVKRGGTLRFAIAGGATSDTPDPALAFTSFRHISGHKRVRPVGAGGCQL